MRILIALLLTIAAAQPAGSTALASQPVWEWPVSGSHVIVRPFIAPTNAYSAGHRGIDIAAVGNVYAPADGVVHFSGYVVNRGVLSITHANGVLSSFEPVTSTLHAGDAVTRGQVIGTIAPGHCSQTCLHFGVRVNGKYVSPMLFLGGVPHSILLPTRAGARSRNSP
jgi:murein DD-endopeptidase MepM/ murein hydrolase activator NlpD